MSLGGDVDNPSGGGGTGGGAPTDATYITQTANGDLSAEQALGALATGLLKNTTTTGVLSIAAEGTDYYKPGGTDVAVADGGTGASDAAGALVNLGLTATASELNTLDGITSSTAELNILDGVTSTAAELNILDGVTATASELNVLDGITASTTELNYTDGVTSAIQTQIDGKAATSHTHTKADLTDVADFLLESEVDADIKTLALPASTTISAYAKTFLDDTDEATLKATLNLETGVDVQAYDANLTTIAGLTATTNNFMVANSSAWASRTPAQARTHMGLGSIATQDANNVTISGGSITGITDLAVADGGTGASTLTGILKGNGTSAVSAISIPSNAQQFLDGTGAFAGNWQLLGTVTGSTLSLTSLTGRQELMIIAFVVASGGTLAVTMTFNNDSGSNYALTRSNANGADTAATSQSALSMNATTAAQNTYLFGTTSNLTASEKVGYFVTVESNSAGAANAPTRRETITKWANTAAQITRVDIAKTGGTGSIGSTSYLMVFGRD